MEAVEIIDYKGYKIEIMYDSDPDSPRNWDPPSTMTTWHRRYKLGDEQPAEGYDQWLEQMAGIDTEVDNYEFSVEDCIRMIKEKGTIILPLYLYDHSNLSISTSPYGCRWDSGQVGFIWITKEQMEKEGWDKEHAVRYMEGEVEVYDQYLQGEVYGYRVLDKEGEEIGSCWGYYGSDHKESGLIEAAESEVSYYIKESIKKHLQQVKTWIQNKVPLMYRKSLAV